MQATIRVVGVELRQPFAAAWGEAPQARQMLLLELDDGEGHAGLGEVTPLPGYDAVSVPDVVEALRDCRQVLTRARPEEHAEVLEACARLTVVPHALAAVDLALWDLAGKRAGQPVWRLLGGENGDRGVEVNATVAVADRAGAAREAAAAREAGFRCLKLKVGLGDDAGRVAAVRAAAGADMALRLDANGAWTVDEARAALRVLAPAGIELCEEPVSGLDAMAALSDGCQVALAIDESTAQPGAFDRRVCDAACLKLGRLGGISGVMAAAARARATGYEVYLASALEGPTGIAAALHAAVALSPSRACGLATLGLFAREPPGLSVRDGRMAPPPGTGLGDGLAEWYG